MKLFYILIPAFILSVLLPVPVFSQTDSATDSGLIDVITDNVKKRISQVAKDRSVLSASTNGAYIGTLQQLTNFTLSINTDEGAKLASTSADTTFTKVPGYTSLSLADLPIDGYVAAIGSIQAGDVLTADTVVYQDKSPLIATEKVYYGTVQAYDTDDYLLTLQNPQDSEPHDFMISRRADVNAWVSDGTKDELTRTQPIDVLTPVLVIYTEGAGTNGEDLAIDVLLNPNP